MAISKERKQELVSEYKDLATSSKGMILTSFSGLSVKETEELRRQIREIGGKFRIVKITLAKMAFEQAGLELPAGALEGSTAIGFGDENITDLAKAIVEVARESELMRIKGGLIDGMIYDAKQVLRLADLPALPILQARLLGLIQAPAGRIAGALSGSVRQVVSVMNAYAESESKETETSPA
ncbi:MAG: 50S ribosomal protein L10 [Anaerolineales bacterium]